MSLVLDRNFLGTVGGAFSDTSLTITAGSPVFGASHYGVSARFPTGVQAHITYTLTTPSTSPGIFSVIAKRSGNPTTQVTVMQLRQAAAPHVSIAIRTDGRLQVIANGGALNGSSVAALPSGTEFRLEAVFNSATSVSVAIYPNLTATTATETVTITGVTSQTVAAVRMGTTDTAASGIEVNFAWPQHETTTTSPGPRKYVYATVDKASFIVPELVTITVADENLPAGTKTYSVNFGDGATAGPQSSPTFTHTYTTAGSYNITPSADVT